MAKPRLPAVKAAVLGAALKNPGRYADRKVPTGTRPLGEAYARMTVEQREAWDEFRQELPWLNSSHRALLRIACILRVRMDDPEIPANHIQTYSAILSKLGATPVDETKVFQPESKPEDPLDRFFNDTRN